MTGRKNFRELRAKVLERPGAAERISEYQREEERELTLAEIRKARDLTQAQLAKTLGMTQPGVSRIESQADLYLSTLRSYVEALGGQLELTVVFPDGVVSLRGLEELEPAALESAGAAVD